MRVKAVKKYAKPGYPTVDYLLEHPELLRHIPKRWRRNRIVLGILSMVIPIIMARQAAIVEAKDLKTNDIRVAPIFIHGDGRGSFGCVVVNPPVFLSEDEARQIVQDEAKKAGITFIADNSTIKDADIPVTSFSAFDNDEQVEKDKKSSKEKKDLVLDGYDEKLNIGYEFISEKDYDEWVDDEEEWSTASDYDLIKTAERLIGGLNQTKIKNESVIGVFYEPGASMPKSRLDTYRELKTEKEIDDYFDAREKVAKELCEKQLREQVRDFIGWLKAQGVI